MPGDLQDASFGETVVKQKPTLSLETFRKTAAIVAEQLEVPIAICVSDPGAAQPFQNKPLADAERDGSEIVDIVRPG